MKSHYLLLVVAIITTTACTTSQQLFYPTKTLVPVFSENSNASIVASGHYAAGNNRSLFGYSLEGHYSPVNKLGLAAAYSNSQNNGTAPYKLNSGIIQAGYYTSSEEVHKIQFSAYGGIEFGKFSANNYFDTINNFKAKIAAGYIDYFLQPGISYQQGNFAASAGVKLGFRNFNNIRITDNPYDTLSAKSAYHYLQEYIDLSYGVKNYKFFAQMLFSSPLQGKTITGETGEVIGTLFFTGLYPQYFNISAGLKIDITRNMFKKK